MISVKKQFFTVNLQQNYSPQQNFSQINHTLYRSMKEVKAKVKNEKKTRKIFKRNKSGKPRK